MGLGALHPSVRVGLTHGAKVGGLGQLSLHLSAALVYLIIDCSLLLYGDD